MLGAFTQYAMVKANPTTVEENLLLSLQNPLGVTPKYVHVECDKTDIPWTQNTYIRESFAFNNLAVNNYTASGGGAQNSILTPYPAETYTPNTNRYYMGVDKIEIGRSGAATGRWSQNTEYTVHIYA